MDFCSFCRENDTGVAVRDQSPAAVVTCSAATMSSIPSVSLIPAVLGSAAALLGVAECVLEELSLPMPSEDKRSLKDLSCALNLSLFCSSLDLNLNLCPVVPGIL